MSLRNDVRESVPRQNRWKSGLIDLVPGRTAIARAAELDVCESEPLAGIAVAEWRYGESLDKATGCLLEERG